ncbi:orexin receptor type 2-like [Acanthaster planci]|uniref:Orexin receptor type 2-like n=1 Tax=Acanthaster planci TaxID=133434 RepID=A0A8B7ZST8_ACAPL|nr:orexin receptor type 2-like [Acanthaster planci]
MDLQTTSEPVTWMPGSFKASSLLIGIDISIGIVGVIGNLVVSLTILKSKGLHSLTHYFLLSLAIADSLVCITGILHAYVITEYNNRTQGAEVLYIVSGYMRRSSTGQSALSLLLVTFERFIGIVRPLHHCSFFTRRKVTLLILFVWIVPAFIEIWGTIWYIVRRGNCAEHLSSLGCDPYLPGFIFIVVNALLLFAVPAAAMIWMYVQILRNLKESARRRQNLGIQGPNELQRARQKLIHALLLVILAFLALIMPEKVMYIVSTAMYQDSENLSIPVLFQFAMILLLVNSTVNPILYALKYDKFREEVISVLCCRLKTSGNQPVPDVKRHMGHTPVSQQAKHQATPMCYESCV